MSIFERGIIADDLAIDVNAYLITYAARMLWSMVTKAS